MPRRTICLTFAPVLMLAAIHSTAALQSRTRDGEDPNFLTPIPVPRFALVMGAQNYHELDKVRNATNDANATATVLSQHGFTTRVVIDPTDADIYDYVDELATKAGGPDAPAIVLLFFAGHGFQQGAFNYIAPINVEKSRVTGRSVPVTSLLQTLGRNRAGLAIVLLDACRTEGPLSSAVASQGFGPIASTANTVIGLAARFGNPARSAAREGDSNSPYTTALVQFMPRPSQSLDVLLDRVNEEVRSLTLGKQEPEQLKGGSSSSVYIVPTQHERDAERRAWETVLATQNPDCVSRYILRYPDSPFLSAALRFLTTPPSGTRGGTRCDF